MPKVLINPTIANKRQKLTAKGKLWPVISVRNDARNVPIMIPK